MEYKVITKAVLNELNEVLESIDESALYKLVEAITKPGVKVMGYSAGRMGFGLKAFLMRLNHLGINAYWFGDNYVPPMNSNDVFICCSNSGNTGSVLNIAEIFKNKSKGTVIGVLGNTESKIGYISDIAIKFKTCNGGLNSADDPSKITSIQPMTTLTEQAMMIMFDIVALKIIEKQNIKLEETKVFHSNIE